MSPRRKIEAPPVLSEPVAQPARSRGLSLVLAAAIALIVVAVGVSTMVLVTHEKNRRALDKNAAAINTVNSFMTLFTSLDPFHANDYADKVLAQATGKLAADYKKRINEVVVQVARAEPTKGTVLDAGVERWNDDGSASVVVATQITTTMPDGKRIEDGKRWVATTIQEGDQWKISDLTQVI